MTLSDFAPVANHLWQSTVFVGVVWLLSLMLRNNRAAVRFWLWLAASLKFLIPFSALVALGRLVEWRPTTTITQPDVTFVIDRISQPFPGSVVTNVSPLASTQSSLLTFLPLALLTIWIVGSAMHLLAWWVRWRRVAKIVGQAVPLENDRESAILRRLEAFTGGHPMTVVSSDASLEPGVFGVLKPVLFWPRGIGLRLSDQQVEALFTHELCHVRRRDNLAAGLHMMVEAAFWFHPLVWSIERRLVDERERACDEEVVRLGGDPQLYAESILKTCEFCAESPLVCVSGVTGSDLKKRVEAIMQGVGFEETLAVWKRLTLVVVVIAVVAAPIAVGLLTTPAIQAQTAVSKPDPAFEVASIKPNKSSEPGYVGFQPGGRFAATRATLQELMSLAFSRGTPLRDSQLVGGPGWMTTDRYDVQAKAEAASDGHERSPQEMFGMIRNLLTERFGLKVRYETRQLPVYVLIRVNPAKLGPRLRVAEWDCYAPFGTAPPPKPAGKSDLRCGVYGGPGRMTGRGMPLAMLVNGRLPRILDRSIVDQTGLTGSFDWDLEWTPAAGESSPPPRPGEPQEPPRDSPWVTTALQEQLGLKLESGRGPVDVLVIESVQRLIDDATEIEPRRPVAPQAVQPASTAVTVDANRRAIASESDGPKASLEEVVAERVAPEGPPTSRQESPATGSPSFEVASVKPNNSGDSRVMMQGGPGGFAATNVTVRMLVRTAYRVQDSQITGGPSWLDSDRFDVAAKSAGKPSQNELQFMLRKLLADRFRLTTHNERTERQIYALVVARGDGRLGPQIMRRDCPSQPPARVTPGSNEPPRCNNIQTGFGRLNFRGAAMSQIAEGLSGYVDRVVLDRTGLGGNYDVELQWTPEQLPPGGGEPSPDGRRIDSDGPSIFTAVQEQLGLKLESTRDPVVVLVIDSVEQPTPD